jgi:hypothetical protein
MVGCVSLAMKVRGLTWLDLVCLALPCLEPACLRQAINEACVGDYLSHPSNPLPVASGFKRPRPMVFAGLFPIDETGFEELDHAMGRFQVGRLTTANATDQSADNSKHNRPFSTPALHLSTRPPPHSSTPHATTPSLHHSTTRAEDVLRVSFPLPTPPPVRSSRTAPSPSSMSTRPPSAVGCAAASSVCSTWR